MATQLLLNFEADLPDTDRDRVRYKVATICNQEGLTFHTVWTQLYHALYMSRGFHALNWKAQCSKRRPSALVEIQRRGLLKELERLVDQRLRTAQPHTAVKPVDAWAAQIDSARFDISEGLTKLVGALRELPTHSI